MTQSEFDPITQPETTVRLESFQVFPISSPESLNLAHYTSRIGELPIKPVSDGEWLVKHDVVARLAALEIVVKRIEESLSSTPKFTLTALQKLREQLGEHMNDLAKAIDEDFAKLSEQENAR